MAERPNILLITSDQQRRDCFGFRGRPIKTPHLDLLASEGTSLEAAITPNVVCQPSRASILTGLLPRTHGVHDNGIDLESSFGEQGFAATLSKAGWKTGIIGKAHFSTYMVFDKTGRVESIPDSVDVPADWRGPYMGFDHAELVMIGHNWWHPNTPPEGLAYEQWYHGDGRGELKNKLLWESARDHHGAPQVWSSKLPVAWHNSTWIADRTTAFLEQNADEPFCVWASFPDPHHPFDAPEPWASLHHPDEVDLPEHRTRDFDRRPWWHRAAVETEIDAKNRDLRQNYSRIPELNDQHLREVIANTFGMISLIDHSVGRILGKLEELGLSDNTYVVYATDHGDWLGDHGLVLKGPMHYEGLMTIGSIVKGPGIAAGAVSHEPCSTLDLMPTMLDWAGVAPERELHGTSWADVLAGGSRDSAFNEWELLPGRVGVGMSLRTVRTRDAKLTLELQSGEGELYNLAEDPNEMDNLFNDASAKGLQADLTDLVMARPDDMRPNQVPVGMA